MKRILPLLIILFIAASEGYSFEPSHPALKEKPKTQTLVLKGNYQQFQTEFSNYKEFQQHDFSHITARGKDDYFMLYVAGGLVVATTTLILTNSGENLTTTTKSEANLGIAAGGFVATGMILTKFFIDRSR